MLSIIHRLALSLCVALATTNSAIALEGNEVRQLIHETFADEPVVAEAMIAIAHCESTGLVHKLPNGSLLPNASGSTARGVFQVLMRVHRPEFIRLGLNPDNDEDYFWYVRHLVRTQGFNPWNPTKHCWGDRVDTSEVLLS